VALPTATPPAAQRLREPGRPPTPAPPSSTSRARTHALGELLRRYDKGGDVFYDTISALHKSVRGSDPDAALYWLARMLDGGMDPRYAGAAPGAHGQRGHRPGRPARAALALDAAEVYERLGSPEGELALAEAGGLPGGGAQVQRRLQGLERGARQVQRDGTPAGAGAPAQRADAADEGPGPRPGYRYAHDEAGGYAAGETYLPEGLEGSASTSRCRAGWSCASRALAELRALTPRRRKPR
jgi:putative ATPase